MRDQSEPPRLYLVSSSPAPRDDRSARRAAIMLAQVRSLLIEADEKETVRLLDITLLQLRMKLRGVSADELNEFCAALSQARQN